MKGHCIFDLPVMMLGAVAGLGANQAVVEHFHLAKWWILVGVVPSFLLGGFLAFHICHLLAGGLAVALDAIAEYFRTKRGDKRIGK